MLTRHGTKLKQISNTVLCLTRNYVPYLAKCVVCKSNAKGKQCKVVTTIVDRKISGSFKG